MRLLWKLRDIGLDSSQLSWSFKAVSHFFVVKVLCQAVRQKPNLHLCGFCKDCYCVFGSALKTLHMFDHNAAIEPKFWKEEIEVK